MSGFKPAVLKAVRLEGPQGSNPSSSAILTRIQQALWQSCISLRLYLGIPR